MAEILTSAPADEVKPPGDTEPVWSYRGYHIKSGEFVTAMVHFFRAEIQRANVWRQRLDATTNWAVVTTAATLSIAFGQPETFHAVIILNMIMVTLFLYIEARRYRYYELWSYRVRLMETDFYAAMLVPPFQPSPDWAESLAENLLSPSYPISMLEAIGRRLRRNYIWLYVMLVCTWLAKLWLHPSPAGSWNQVIDRATIGPVEGRVVLIAAACFFGLLLLLGMGTIGLHQATGEVLPRFGADDKMETRSSGQTSKGAWAHFGPRRRRRQFLALIITEAAEAVAKGIMANLNRGVTALQGTGMYTGQGRTVLMCALTATEVNRLKAVTAREDPKAFVVISGAQEVLGGGFFPLQE
jgi:uncharacterized membrane protein